MWGTGSYTIQVYLYIIWKIISIIYCGEIYFSFYCVFNVAFTKFMMDLGGILFKYVMRIEIKNYVIKLK